jgi:hypothetical protein
MASLMWLLAAPTVYLVLASFGMLQFAVLLNALANLTHALDRMPALEPLAPGERAGGLWPGPTCAVDRSNQLAPAVVNV